MSQRERWSSRFVFVTAAVGSAVGLGNIWRFPYIAYENGGGAFFIPYFIALISTGIPLVILEYALGQWFQSGAPGAMAKIRKGFRWVGWMALLVGTSVVFYYVGIMGYSWRYMIKSVTLDWTKPVDDRTVLKVVYEADEDIEAIDELFRTWKDKLGEDAEIYDEPAELTAYVEKIASGDVDTSKRTVPHAAILSKPAMNQVESQINYYYSRQVEEYKRTAEPDQELTYPEERRIRLLTETDNIAVYFSEITLGGFEIEKWQKKAARNRKINEHIKLLESDSQKSEDFDWQFLAELTPRIKTLSQEIKGRLIPHSEIEGEISEGEPGQSVDYGNIKNQLIQSLESARVSYVSDMFSIDVGLYFWILLTWVIVFLCIIKGVESVGKVVMFTVPGPLILLGILIIQGLSLKGSGQGIDFFLSPNWELLKNPRVWLAAYGQIFFSLSLGFGILIAYASYQSEESEVSNNAFMTSFCNCATSFYASFAVFSVLGYMAVAMNQTVGDVVKTGPGLVFVTYPTALAKMGDMGKLVGILFFFSLLLLGIDSAFSLVESIVTGLRDVLKKVNRLYINTAVCLVGAIIGIVFSMKSGLMWLDIVDNWMSNYGLVLVGVLECIAVGYFFRIEEIREFVNRKSEIHLGPWWDAFIKVVTPIILFYLLGTQFLKDITETYGNYDAVLKYSVAFAGWGYFMLLLLIAFILGKNWLPLVWLLSGVVLSGFFMIFTGNPAASSMGALGAVLLLGGFLTCLRIAVKAKKDS